MKSKVAVIPCDSYDPGMVSAAIEKGIALLGGWERFVHKEEKLLLKPNLLNRAEVDKAVTTHPSVFEAVAKELRNNGYERVWYGDSPGHPGNVEKTAEVCGIKEMADRFHIPLADFSHGKTVEYKRGNILRKYELCQGVLETDAIINLCKMKTHQLETITGAVKNLFGCVFGLNKGAAHAKYPDAESFAHMLIDLNLLLKPRLHIMDGVIAMEGNGPASGNPTKMGLILMSDDPVALDATFCRLVDLDPATVPTVYYGEVFGLGHWKEDDIELLGIESLREYIKPEFDVVREKVPRGKWAAFDKLKALARKPVIVDSRCIRCGACVAACPVEEKAVFFPKSGKGPDGKAAEVPVYDYQKCIRCYCCQEMCPEKAIIVKRKLL